MPDDDHDDREGDDDYYDVTFHYDGADHDHSINYNRRFDHRPRHDVVNDELLLDHIRTNDYYDG